MSKRKFVQCASQVKKGAVRRESVDGVEHIIVSSFTLPDNVVMNGGMYPADEIAASYQSLERTLAPIEHPVKDGLFVSAADPYAIHNFHAGAFNLNVKRENGRVSLDKYINVQEARKTERGKRLLDRINELETNDKPRPIHTSTGVFLEVEVLPGPQTNAAGQEYTWIAKNMVFDHDAILLDSIGAATPGDGVGMAVNFNGEKLDVERYVMDVEDSQSTQMTSVQQTMEDLRGSLVGIISSDWLYIVDLIGDQCIFETEKGYMKVPYVIGDNGATPAGIPIRVEKSVRYLPATNAGADNPITRKMVGNDLYLVYTPTKTSKGDAMKEMLINALAAAGVKTEGLDDAALLAAYDKLQATNSKSDDNGATANDDIAKIVANAVQSAVAPVAQELDGLRKQLNANAEAEKLQYAEIVANSDKYPAIDLATAKLLPLEKLKEMAANCGAGYGLPLNTNGQPGSGFAATEMPA